MSEKFKPKHIVSWIFDKVIIVSDMPVLKQIKTVLRYVFVEISPEIPISLDNSLYGAKGKKTALYAAFVTFLFTFVVISIWTYFDGTFFVDDDPTRYSFLEDTSNLWLYTIVCPVYVGLGAWLSLVTFQGWNDIRKFDEELSSEKKSEKFKVPAKGIFLPILIFGIAFSLTVNYINDVTNISDGSSRVYYWFLNDNGELGMLGIYYFLINFMLLLVTLISLTCFMSLFSIMLRVGSTLNTASGNIDLQFEVVKRKLSAFTEGYLLAKGIIAAYIINFYLWERSLLGAAAGVNLQITYVLLVIIGYFLISIPRYNIELQWKKYLFRIGKIDQSSEISIDLRSIKAHNIARVLDWLIISAFATSSLDIEKLVDFIM